MWITSTTGFYSVVQHRQDHGLVLIRARARKDLERLCAISNEKVHPEWRHMDPSAIVDSPKADYPARLIVPKAAWLAAITELTDEIDYDNFKNAVKDKAPTKAEGFDRSNIYMGVWSQLRKIEHEDRDPEEYGIEDRLFGPEGHAWSLCGCSAMDDDNPGPHHSVHCEMWAEDSPDPAVA